MIAKQNGHFFRQRAGVCPPFVRNSFPVFDGCHEFNARIYAWIATHKIDGVILSADWYRYSASNRDIATLLSELRATVDLLRKEHVPVFLIGPTFRYAAPLPVILARYVESGDEPGLQPSHFLSPYPGVLDRAMKAAFGAVPGVAYISLIDRICQAKQCPFLANGNIPFQSDINASDASRSALRIRRRLGAGPCPRIARAGCFLSPTRRPVPASRAVRCIRFFGPLAVNP